MFKLRKKIPVLVGPTASGKTALSIALAERLPGEIISADSRQVYKYLDIGTDKPSVKIRRTIPHHFIDYKKPDEYFSAGEFGREARSKIKELLERDKWPLVVGGSGLYLRALTDGLFGPRITDPEIKQALRERVDKEGLDTLYQYLRKVDPYTADRLHSNDAQRIIRALEVYEISAIPLSQHHAEQQLTQDYLWHFIGLRWPRKKLYERIEQRIDVMFQRGLVDEVSNLYKQGYTPRLNSLRSVGYKELFAHLEGACDLDEAIAEIKKNSRNYAKRQITWFGRDERIQWFDITESTDFELLAQQIGSKIRG